MINISSTFVFVNVLSIFICNIYMLCTRWEIRTEKIFHEFLKTAQGRADRPKR